MSEDYQQSYFEQYEARREIERRRKRRQRLSESSGYSGIKAQPDGTFKWVTTPEEPSVANACSGTSIVPSQWHNRYRCTSGHDNSPQYRLRKTYTFIGDVKVLQDCHIERKDYPDSELWHVQEDVFNEYNI